MWLRISGGGKPTQVVPVGDLREHDVDNGPCWCDPTYDYEDNGVLIVIHKSADEREKFETGQRLRS